MNPSGENAKAIIQESGNNAEDENSRRNDATEEALNESNVHLSMYNGVCRGENNKTPNEDDEWTLKMNLTQEWFIRCSWINKFLFVKALCVSTKWNFVIESLLKLLESILAKDVVESIGNEYTEFTYDKIPSDDDRSLPVEDLNKIIHSDFIWFLGLKPARQISVIVSLLKLGGGGLVFNVYKTLTGIYRERKLSEAREGSLSAKSQSEFNIKASRQKMKKISRTTLSKQNVASSSSDSVQPGSPPSNEYTSRKFEELARREAAIAEYKRSKGITCEVESKTSKRDDARETLDYFQILPICLNRKIMSHVDEKALSGFKKVGRYWGKMIDESINEKSSRRAINAKINKIIGTKPDRRKEERQKRKDNEEKLRGEDDDDDDDDREITRDDELKTSIELGQKEFHKRNNLCEKVLISSMKTYEDILSKKFKTIKLDKSFYGERFCCWDDQIELMACSSSNNAVYFYSLRTGSMLNYFVFDVESTITCLALHDSRIQIILGCKDGTLMSKFLRTNKIGTKFSGHKTAVKFLSVTTSNLLSSSEDNLIKYFQLWSGVCLFCIDLNLEFTVSCQLLLRSSASIDYCLLGTVQGVLILFDAAANGKTFSRKLKVHDGEITAMCKRDNILATADEKGKVKVWSVSQLESDAEALLPFYNVNVVNTAVTSLFLDCNQVFAGCENGTVKIINLGCGKVYKTLKICGQMMIRAAVVIEDRFSLKVTIWHEGGIEMRIFSLAKCPRNKKLTGANDEKRCGDKAKALRDRHKFYQQLLSSATLLDLVTKTQ